MPATLGRTSLLGLVLFASAGFTRAETIPPQPVDGKIQWVYDYEEGKRLGKEKNKPLFVVFRCER